MAAKRRARRLRFDELGRNGGNEGSDNDDEESGKSGEDAIPSPLKRAEERSPSSREDAGSQGSGEASPACGGVALKTKTTPSKRLKKPPPASQEKDEAEDSGDASPARGRLPDHSADAGHDNKTAATPKRGEKRSPPPRQEDERPEKRAAGPDADTLAAKSPKRKRKAEKDRLRSAKSPKRKRKAEKDRLKKKKKKQLRKALTKPMSPPQLLELELNDRTPSSPHIAQEDEHHGREMAGQEQSNTSPPQDERRAREEEQQEKMIAEEEHAGDTSPPHDKDMHSAHVEEQQEEEVANLENADDTPPSPPKDNHSVDEEELPKDTSPPQEKNREQEDEETGAQVNSEALQVNAPSKLRGSETEKKPAVERSWSYDDELKILNALVEHAQSHDGALPDSSHLLANLTFDKIDANEEKLTDKIRKLRARYRRMLSQGCPSDRHARRLFKLSEKLWGQVDEDEQVEPTSRDFSALTSRDFSALSKLYPHLAKEVKAYAEAHSSGDLIMARFMTIGDQKARDLDAKCKKQQIEAFKLELGQASLINELLSALSSPTLVKF